MKNLIIRVLIAVTVSGWFPAFAQTYQQFHLFPLTLGSSWNYDDGSIALVSSANDNNGSLSAIITNKNTIPHGPGYSSFIADATQVRIGGGSQASYIIFNGSLGYYPVVVRPMSLGQSWTSYWYSNGYLVDQTETVTATNTAVTIRGNVFPNCTELTVVNRFPNGYTSGQTRWTRNYYYFLPQVGCIKRVMTSDDRKTNIVQAISWDIKGASIPVIISQQPEDQVEVGGQTAAFIVSAYGTGALKYQWRKNGVNLSNGGRISGATSARLILTGVLPADASDYSVEISNAYGTLISSNAHLRVVPSNQSYDLVDYHWPVYPGNEWVYDTQGTGTSKTVFRVEAASVQVTCFTRRSPVRSVTRYAARIYAAYGDYDFNGDFIPDDEWYEYPPVNSGWGMLGYDDDPGDMEMRIDPPVSIAKRVTVGETFSFTANVYINGQYQGQASLKCAIADYNSVTVPAGTYPDCLHLRYTMIAGGETQTNDEWWAKGVGMVRKTRHVVKPNRVNNELYELTRSSFVGPTRITMTPRSATNSLGATVSFSVEAIGTEPLTCQWRKDDIDLTDTADLSGADTTNLVITNLKFSDAGSYTVVVTGAYGVVTSAPPAVLTVIDRLSPSLAVTSHADTDLLSAKAVTVVGTATDAGNGDNGIASVTVNGVRAANDTTTGAGAANWARTVALTLGTNRLVVVARDGRGNATTNLLRLISDTATPRLTITVPRSGQRWSNEVLTAAGTATDNVDVREVWYRLNGATWLPAQGTTPWNGQAMLIQRSNLLEALAIDFVGNRTTGRVAFAYVVTSPITLLTNGLGSIKPSFAGSILEVGAPYSVTAAPSTGHVFSNWVGAITSTNNPLKFAMQSNMVLQANFVPNPFIPLRGTYDGLFRPVADNAVNGTNAGALTLTLTSDRGAFSGTVRLAGKTHPFSGALNLARQTTVTIARTGTTPLTINLVFDGQNLTGQANSANWVADVLALRRSTATSNLFAGRYSLLVMGRHEATDAPPGDSALGVTVAALGAVSVSGSMADGSPVTLAAGQSVDGRWPFYASLFSGRGVALGWITCAANPTAQEILWVKGPDAAARIYPAGFSELREAAIQRYQTPALKQTATTWTLGRLLVGGGNLATPLEAEVLVTNNLIKRIGGTVSNLSLTITNGNGRFGGSFVHPATGKATPLQGVLVQGLPWVAPAEQVTVGGGWFNGTNQSGWLWLEPQP